MLGKMTFGSEHGLDNRAQKVEVDDSSCAEDRFVVLQMSEELACILRHYVDKSPAIPGLPANASWTDCRQHAAHWIHAEQE